jgi:hypothetical protein
MSPEFAGVVSVYMTPAKCAIYIPTYTELASWGCSITRTKSVSHVANKIHDPFLHQLWRVINFRERHLNFYRVNLSHSFFKEILFKRIAELSTVDSPADSSKLMND